MKKRQPHVNNRIINNAFEELDTYPDLSTLVSHILNSIEVKEVKVFLPSSFDTTLIKHPDVLVPVRELVIGNVVFNYIRHRAQDILYGLKERMGKINQDKLLSFTDRLALFRKLRINILNQYRYFDTMNPIRYMSSYQWKIVYTVEKNGKMIEKRKEYPNSKIDLKVGHWNMLDNAFLIRRNLLYEMLYLIDVELRILEEDLGETKYKWIEKKSYEIHELLVALIASGRVEYCKGDERTFIHDFLSLFSVTDEKFAYKKDKVLQRTHRSHLLTELNNTLENYRKPTQKKPAN